MKQKTLMTLAAMMIFIGGIANTINITREPKPLKKTTVSFAVEANCGDCKNRIENSLDKKGVYKAIFNLDSKILTVTYDPRKL